MKKCLLTLLIALITLTSFAQITVNVPTAGGFSAALTATGGDANTATNLIVIGNIDARDIKFMRDNMPLLAILDLTALQIKAYTGTGGTKTGSIIYPANEMPQYSFHIYNTTGGKISLTSIKLPNSITSIGDGAFKYCSGLKGSLTIPNSVTSIGNSAFFDCSGLVGSLNIPNKVISIGDGAFGICSGFTGSLIIPNSVINIGNGAFGYCKGLTGSLIIPNSVTSIGNNAFGNCSGFTGDLILPNSIDSIKDGVFSSCSGFTGSLIIPNSVTFIGDIAFTHCNGFNGNLRIPNSVTSIGKYAFGNCIEFTGNLSIPNSVTTIENGAFFNCSGFTGALSIGNSLTYIGNNAFDGCTGFTDSLIIPNSLTHIGNEAFWGCSGFIGSLVLPNSTTFLGSNAFQGCSGFIGDITIPNSVTYIGYGPFSGCSKIISLSVDENNSRFRVIDGILYNNDNTILIQFPSGKVADSYRIPNSVTSIQDWAFYECNKFTGKLSIPNSVTYIGGNAFSGCKEINNLILPSSLTSIGDYAYSNCLSLSNITVAKLIPLNIRRYTFDKVNKTTCQLIVPAGSKAAYQAANYWKDFTNITEAIFVTFNTKKGTPIADTIVNANTTVVAPKDPFRKKSTFVGWFKDSTYINNWNFTSDLVTTNTTIYAKWTNKVKFNTLGGNAMADTIVTADTKITAPKDPFKTNLKFAGWYKDTLYTKAWNFTSDIVSADTTLYAGWISIPTSIPSTGIANLNIFPNPATDYIKIEGEKLNSITIYDLSGAVQMQSYLKGKESITININNLNPGYYLVRVKTINDEERILKFFKN